MVCFCFLVDQRRKVWRTKPVAGTCSRCGSGASVADIKTSTRNCATLGQGSEEEEDIARQEAGSKVVKPEGGMIPCRNTAEEAR
ncbi:hypothetical protein DVH24_003571 [Malus domestica]|uniref:Uncharacterized protein n=1 Tax=Malus domestica TaxID=3750 RepID=A0A498IPB8_MALDO|nr:hypothetical protein DVH24_003571 [Malus domestica]